MNNRATDVLRNILTAFEASNNWMHAGPAKFIKDVLTEIESDMQRDFLTIGIELGTTVDKQIVYIDQYVRSKGFMRLHYKEALMANLTALWVKYDVNGLRSGQYVSVCTRNGWIVQVGNEDRKYSDGASVFVDLDIDSETANAAISKWLEGAIEQME
jgi:hypothetical protein